MHNPNKDTGWFSNDESRKKNGHRSLKGISIFAVIFYHIGILESGYLGVDVFLVIAGFDNSLTEIKSKCSRIPICTLARTHGT